MNLIQEIQDAWGWVGIVPATVVGENEFGNLIIEDTQGKYWRLCPEDLYCEVVANNRSELDYLSNDQDFLEDWYMQQLVEQSKEYIGQLHQNHKYCLVTPGPLGGEYTVKNIKTAPLVELVRVSGNLAYQIKNLPDGAQIELKLVK